MAWNLDLLQGILNENKEKLYKLDKNLKLDQLELEYQKKINGFSPAYLSGSSWYVGPSLIDAFQKQPFDHRLLTNIFYYLIKQKEK